MSKFVVFKGCDAEDKVYGVPVSNRCESESEVLSEDLSEVFGDQLTFEVGDLSFFIVFGP